ncbi:MAG: hypothetical protein NVS3B21_31300 [Acidimicrobiales bacterium]
MTHATSVLLDAAVFIVGAVVAIAVVGSSVRTIVVPRGISARLARFVFVAVRLVFKIRIRSKTSFATRDRLLAGYAPVALFALLATWIIGLLMAYTAMLWAAGVHPLRRAFTMSGSSIFTLGFSVPGTLPQVVLALTESALGLAELALLITFLPNIYADFHRRELEVTKLRVEAGSPPQGATILTRLHALERLDARTDVWVRWIDWFADVEDTHTAVPSLAFFRSGVPELSWVTATGAVLDGAALSASCLDLPRDLEAELCVRAGYLCLRRIAELFDLPFDPEPSAVDPISIARAEFDGVWSQMAAAGLPLRPDRDQSWRDFAGWRVNYDEALIRLANVTEAPPALWSSDRGLVAGKPLTFLERIRQ